MLGSDSGVHVRSGGGGGGEGGGKGARGQNLELLKKLYFLNFFLLPCLEIILTCIICTLYGLPCS